jgi:hypothetical protein
MFFLKRPRSPMRPTAFRETLQSLSSRPLVMIAKEWYKRMVGIG